MSIENMIEYQKKDKEVYRLEKNFSKLPERDKYTKIQNMYKVKQNNITSLTQELQDTISQINDLAVKLDGLEKMNTQLEVDVNFETAQEYKNYESILSKYEDELNFINRESARLYKRMNEIGADNNKALEQLSSLQREGSVVWKEFMAKKHEMLAKANPIVKELEKLAKGIDPAMLVQYKASRAQKIFPVFIPYTEEGNCYACGMNVKIEVGKKLVNSGDYTKCPNCGRILYKE
jgi:predicted  nucleic acid-binding Zn-ribbon protein